MPKFFISVAFIPSKSDALSSGIIASFSMCGGKAIKALFNYLSIIHQPNKQNIRRGSEHVHPYY